MTRTVFEAATESKQALVSAVLPLICKSCGHAGDCYRRQACANDILASLDEPAQDETPDKVHAPHTKKKKGKS